MILGNRSQLRNSGSRVANILRSIRENREGRLRSVSIASEQRANFRPYNTGSRRKPPSKPQSWTVRMVCLNSRYARKVPVTARERETLVSSDLGEKKIVVADTSCSWEEFKSTISKEFPKLSDIRGFEFLRCIPNTKTLELISPVVSQSPKLLRNVVGSGRIFIRPIQQDLKLDKGLIAENDTEVISNIRYSMEYTSYIT